MISESKMRTKFIAAGLLALSVAASADTIPTGLSKAPQFRIGADIAPSWVPPTGQFVKGNNPEERRITTGLSGDLRADFSFNPSTREGMLYPGLYQGVGLGVSSYLPGNMLGSPVSLYVYQGAPIVRLSDRLSLDYEWQFGAAMGWKHNDDQSLDNTAAVSTSVTAHMGLGLKLRYALSDRWQLSAGLAARHYSNGNTSWPNAGVNTLGATVGVAYLINPADKTTASPDPELCADADAHRWFYDIMAYGAWRKRAVYVGQPLEANLCPGRFPVAGLQFAPTCRLNRYVAVGPALDLQWDQSACLAPYWLSGSYGENIKFYRPPFGKQISAGLSAHAELTMPVFAVNAGLGYDFISPRGDRRFYQTLTLKTFLTRRIYLNTGYRLRAFKDPDHLILGLGFRL